MAILVRTSSTKWKSAKKLEFKEESHLQRLLHDSPDLLVTQQEEMPAIFVREAGLPGSGHTDLLGVDARGNILIVEGNILIVESKLAKNQDIRRKVIGQILEYAAYLWKMRYEEFDRLFESRAGKSIAELFSEKLDSVPIDEIKGRVSENLENGKFKLLIAVDTMNPELEKIIAYLSNFGGFSLEALEVNIYQQGDTEIFVPQRHGSLQPDGGRSGSPLSLDEVMANSPDDHSRLLYRLLVDEWRKLGHVVQPGTAGASFKADINGHPQPIFWAFPSYLQPVMSVMTSRGAPATALADYRTTLSELPGFDAKRITNDAKPPVDLAEISETEVRKFIAASDKLAKEWKTATFLTVP